MLVPAAMPVTTPLLLPIFILVLLLLHIPVALSVSAIVCPMHTTEGPLIAGGSAFTVTILLTAHPAGVLYDTVSVPVLIPASIPAVLIVPVVTGMQLHVPPASVRVVVLPAHRLPAPVIAAGIVFTVTTAVATQPGPVV